MVTRRPGHSLPELLVALTFLGASVAAVSASALVGARLTAGAAARQDALRLAAAVLDSLSATPAPTSGGGEVRGLRVDWWVDAGTDPSGLRVEVRDPGSRLLAVLRGAHHPTIPVLPGPVAGAGP